MVNWNFNAADYEEQSFKPIPVGDHRVRIASAEEQTSSAGNQMIVLQLEVSDYSSKIFHNLVLLKDNPKLVNQKLGELWNSFGIPQGNFNLNSWVGKVGAAKVKHEEWNSEMRAKVAYFINRERQDKLPEWKEGNNSNSVNVNFAEVATDDLPFN
jgi:hypothetical protein